MHTYTIPWHHLVEDADGNERRVAFTVHYRYWPGCAAVRYGYHGGSPAEPADVDPVRVDVPEGASQADADGLLRTLKWPGVVAEVWRERAIEAVETRDERRVAS